jgi:hypothetical protein
MRRTDAADLRRARFAVSWPVSRSSTKLRLVIRHFDSPGCVCANVAPFEAIAVKSASAKPGLFLMVAPFPFSGQLVAMKYVYYESEAMAPWPEWPSSGAR